MGVVPGIIVGGIGVPVAVPAVVAIVLPLSAAAGIIPDADAVVEVPRRSSSSSSSSRKEYIRSNRHVNGKPSLWYLFMRLFHVNRASLGLPTAFHASCNFWGGASLAIPDFLFASVFERDASLDESRSEGRLSNGASSERLMFMSPQIIHRRLPGTSLSTYSSLHHSTTRRICSILRASFVFPGQK